MTHREHSRTDDRLVLSRAVLRMSSPISLKKISQKVRGEITKMMTQRLLGLCEEDWLVSRIPPDWMKQRWKI